MVQLGSSVATPELPVLCVSHNSSSAKLVVPDVTDGVVLLPSVVVTTKSTQEDAVCMPVAKAALARAAVTLVVQDTRMVLPVVAAATFSQMNVRTSMSPVPWAASVFTTV